MPLGTCHSFSQNMKINIKKYSSDEFILNVATQQTDVYQKQNIEFI